MASKKDKQNIRKSITGTSANAIRGIFTGSVVNSDFFFRHKLKIFVLLVLMMLYISTKYECMTGMESIRKLETKLEVIKTERIREKSFYMSRIRESSMTQIADSVRPGLCVQQQPPYHLILEKD